MDADLILDQALERVLRDKKVKKEVKEVCKGLLELSPHREKEKG